MTVQVSLMRLSYFSCLPPTGTWAHSCPFLGRELTIPAFTNYLSKYTHFIHNHTCIQQSFVFTMHKHTHTHTYIYNQKARESSKSFSPLCFVPSWNPHHHCGFSCSQPLSLHRECWTNLSRSWHLVSLVYSRPLNHGVSPHGLSRLLGLPRPTSTLFFITSHSELSRTVTCPHAPIGCSHSLRLQWYLYPNIE